MPRALLTSASKVGQWNLVRNVLTPADYTYTRYGPAVLAASAIYCALCNLATQRRLVVPARDREAVFDLPRRIPAEQQAALRECMFYVQETHQAAFDEPVALMTPPTPTARSAEVSPLTVCNVDFSGNC